MLEVNRKSREYFELCRIATYPQMAGKDKKELLTWHYENSLNDTERMVRAEKVKAIEKEAGFAPPDAGLSFFGQARLNR